MNPYIIEKKVSYNHEGEIDSTVYLIKQKRKWMGLINYWWYLKKPGWEYDFRVEFDTQEDAQKVIDRMCSGIVPNSLQFEEVSEYICN